MFVRSYESCGRNSFAVLYGYANEENKGKPEKWFFTPSVGKWSGSGRYARA